jgi:hypothetical protein
MRKPRVQRKRGFDSISETNAAWDMIAVEHSKRQRGNILNLPANTRLIRQEMLDSLIFWIPPISKSKKLYKHKRLPNWV